MTDAVLAGLLLAAGTSTPSPSLPAQAPDPNSVTPGFLGFVVVFVLAIATWLLLRNLTARLRRMRYREEGRMAAERAERAERAGRAGRAEPDDGRPGRR